MKVSENAKVNAPSQKKPVHGKNLKKVGSTGQQKNLPPLAFMIFDLTSKSQDARIIKITQLTVFNNGETELSHHLFNNEETPISEEAYAHHRLSAEDLKDKPKLSTFDFFVAKNIVVWDGKVTRNILRKHGITQFPSTINMQALARHIEGIPGAISLNSYALKASPKRKNIIEFMLKKPENKIHVMPEIYEHLKTQYLAKYDENSPAFLVTIGKCRTQKDALAAIKVFLEKRKIMQKAKQNKGRGKPHVKVNNQSQKPATEKKVIVINTSTNQGVKAVVVKKRAR